MGWGGRLFEVGANSKLGAYSNKYGKSAEKRNKLSPGIGLCQELIMCSNNLTLPFPQNFSIPSRVHKLKA